MADEKAPRLAVLIDAENASHRIAEALFSEIATLGEASARRIYGDFASPQIAGWTKVLARFAIQPQQNFANTKGKNSGDIALVIDAMDLLHSGRFDGFCLVSSDADFTRLAARIREEGVDVYGFGEQKTPESFRQACTRFIYTENLSAPAEIDNGAAKSPAVAAPAAKRKPSEAARLIAAASSVNTPLAERAIDCAVAPGAGSMRSRSSRLRAIARVIARPRFSSISPECRIATVRWMASWSAAV